MIRKVSSLFFCIVVMMSLLIIPVYADDMTYNVTLPEGSTGQEKYSSGVEGVYKFKLPNPDDGNFYKVEAKIGEKIYLIGDYYEGFEEGIGEYILPGRNIDGNVTITATQLPKAQTPDKVFESANQGSGNSAENPYLIKSEDDLITLLIYSAYGNEFTPGSMYDSYQAFCGKDVYYRLEKNIKLVRAIGHTVHDTIFGKAILTLGGSDGFKDRGFYGEFDGNGHTISNVTAATYYDKEQNKVFTCYGGLCANNFGVIKNLKLEMENDFTTQNMYIGVPDQSDFANGALVSVNHGVIENCQVSGSLTFYSKYGKNEKDFIEYVGMIAGQNNGEILNCKTYGTLSSQTIINNDKITKYVGGIAGSTEGLAKSINCENNANITVEDKNVTADLLRDVGGISGYLNCSKTGGQIVNCINTGNINLTTSGSRSRVGGLVGTASIKSSIIGSYTIGKVSSEASEQKGGSLIGAIREDPKITSCFSYVDNSVAPVGEIRQVNDVIHTITECYALGNEDKDNSANNNVSILTADMFKKAALVEKLNSKLPDDTPKVFALEDGAKYPTLVDRKGSSTIDIKVENKTGETPIATLTVPEGGWKAGENTFTVSAAKACVVAVKNSDDTYTRLIATKVGDSEDTYSFTANLEDGMTIVTSLKGDVNSDGKLDVYDVLAANVICKGFDKSAFAKLMADINCDGTIDVYEVLGLNVAVKGFRVLNW